jgi:nucleotide-binding universal stress UspA family protein
MTSSAAYTKIAVAIDGSSTSDLALAEAIRVAAPAGSTVLAFYVVDNPTLYFDAGYCDPTLIQQGFAESGRKALASAAGRLHAARVPYETELVDDQPIAGDLAASVNETARRWGADLLVIGTHGRRGVRRVVLGSVAEAVLRLSTMPVLLVRGADE